jgi:Zn finger protein HypA/HybF involved in hydrogenase expression
MSRKRTSKIWSIDTTEFKRVINESGSISMVLKYFGLKNIGCNYITLRKRCEEEGIDYSHIPRGLSSNFGRKFNRKKKIPLEKILVKNSNYSRSSLKRRIIKNDLLKYECSLCLNSGVWNNQPLTLQLDHINGINNDHRLENLRFLCPNCHSQTSNFAGKNSKQIKKINICSGCGDDISRNSIKCLSCDREGRRKVPNRPSLEQLEKDLETMSYVAVGKKYGVSDNCIRKWLKAYRN